MASRHRVLEHSNPRVVDNTIVGVKIIGPTSLHGWSYPGAVLRKAKPLYESAPVFALHPSGREDKAGSRKLNAHFGALINVRERGQVGEVGLYGDLQMRPSHPITQHVLENIDEIMGLSHNAIVDMDDGDTIVREIIAVNSVDLVHNPATTRTLFEGEREIMPEDTNAAAGAAGAAGDVTQDGGSFEEKMLGFMAKILAYVEPKDAALVKDAEAAAALPVKEGLPPKKRPVRFGVLESMPEGADGGLVAKGKSNAELMAMLRGEA